MNLSAVFQNLTTNTNQTANTVQTDGQVVVNAQAARTLAEIQSLVPGQTVEGQVMSREGALVQLALSDGTTLSARLDQDIQLAMGQNLLFEVKSNSGSLLSLTPLYANLSGQDMAMQALSAAGMSQTSENLQMVSLMMQEGMSVDKDSLAYMSRQMADYPSAEMPTIVQMVRMDMPITELSIDQYSQYQNTASTFAETAADLTEQLPQVYNELLSEGKDAEAVSFFRQVVDVFAGGEAASLDMPLAAGTPPILAQPEAAPGMPAETIAGQEVDATRVTTEQVQEQVEAHQQMTDTLERTGLSETSLRELGETLQKLGADSEVARQVSEGTLSVKQTMSQINELLTAHSAFQSEENYEGTIKELFGSKGFQELFKTQMAAQWTIEPGDFADKEKVSQLYERIRQQSSQLEEILTQVGKEGSDAGKSSQNLQNNLDFTNQMNQMFAYIQLPLKMSGGDTHADLYIYTNKRSLAREDGTVSALLHLDMTHLGPVDIYVTMETANNKVTTDFTLQDEETLDLIEENIHILDEHLTDRGYQMNVTCKVKEPENEGKEQAQAQPHPVPNNGKVALLGHSSFDIRA